MKNDLTNHFFENTDIGKVALNKFGVVKENFRIYEVGHMIEHGAVSQLIKVTGAEFRKAKSGPNKGKLCIEIPKTKITTYILPEEIKKC